MDKYLDDIERIEAYLDGSMSKADRIVFSKRLAEESLLATQFAHRKIFQKSWVNAEQHDRLKRCIKTIITKEKKAASYHRRVILIAASVILLAAVGTILLLTTEKHVLNPGIAGKKQNVDQPDRALKPDQNYMEEVAVADSVNNKEATLYLPLNNASFIKSDTIHFKWSSAGALVSLKVYSFPGNFLVKEVQIPKGRFEYYLFPYVLKQGKYSWSVSGCDNRFYFTVK